MSLIDDRGRVFGRVNLIDAFVTILVLALIPLAYAAYLMFRAPMPKIVEISPQEFSESALSSDHHDRPRLQIKGENLREALVVRFGEVISEGWLIQDGRRAEAVMPILAAGIYDMSLSDGGRVLLRVPGALRVVAPPSPAKVEEVPIPSALALITVRFVSEPEVVAVMNVGDVDVAGPEPETNRAILTEIGKERETSSALMVVESVLGRNSFQIQRPVLVFTGKLRVPVVSTPVGWSYKDRPVKVGGPFSFVTMSGAMGGSILAVKVVPQK